MVGFFFSRRPARGYELALYNGKYALIECGGQLKIYGGLSLVPPSPDDMGVGKQAYHVQLSALFEGLRRASIPFMYILRAVPMGRGEMVSFSLLVVTWVAGRSETLEKATQRLDEHLKILHAALSVALPGATIRPLGGREIYDFFMHLIGKDEERSSLLTPAQASELASLPFVEPWEASRAPPLFHIPAATAPSSSPSIPLGRSVVGDTQGPPVSIELQELSRHACLLGATGSGKSVTVGLLVARAQELGVPSLVIDWHSEYRQLVQSLGGNVFAPGLDGPLFNPLEPLAGVRDLSEHVDLITDIFTDVYRFTAPQSYMFKSTLEDLLATCPEPPTLTDLVQAIERRPIRSAYDNETKMALLRRLVPLTRGQVAAALDRRSPHPFESLLNKTTAVELGHFRELETRTIIASLLLKMVYDYRVGRGPSPLAHLTVVEEARFLVPPRRPEDPPGVVEKMVAELRKFGEGVILVAQFPTQIASEVVKNVGVKLIFRTAWLDDLRLLRDALGLTEEQVKYLTNMPTGEAVLTSIKLSRPVLLKVDASSVLPHLKKEVQPPLRVKD